MDRAVLPAVIDRRRASQEPDQAQRKQDDEQPAGPARLSFGRIGGDRLHRVTLPRADPGCKEEVG